MHEYHLSNHMCTGKISCLAFCIFELQLQKDWEQLSAKALLHVGKAAGPEAKQHYKLISSSHICMLILGPNPMASY